MYMIIKLITVLKTDSETIANVGNINNSIQLKNRAITAKKVIFLRYRLKANADAQNNNIIIPIKSLSKVASKSLLSDG